MLQQKVGALNAIPWTSIVAQTLESHTLESHMASLY